MSYQDDPAAFEARLKVRMRPENIRSTLMFASLYQITNEMIADVVVDKVHDFYCTRLDDKCDTADVAHGRYQDNVLSLAKSVFQASLLWLVEANAVTQEQADQLKPIYAHRNTLTHELVRFVVDPDAELDVELFSDAVAILKDLHRFWIDIELSTGGFFPLDGTDLPPVETDDVVPFSLVILQNCLDAFVESWPA